MTDSYDNPAAPPARRRSAASLRSARWFAPDDLRSLRPPLAHDADGLRAGGLGGRPVIAILNTWSDLNPCHAHFKQRVEDVKRGVSQAGGFPIELPAHLARRELRQADDDALSQPAGHGGRGAAARASRRRRGADGRLRQDDAGPADGRDQRGLPAIFLPAGPMLRGNWHGQGARLGLGRLEVLGRAARRQHHRARLARRSKAASPAATAPA